MIFRFGLAGSFLILMACSAPDTEATRFTQFSSNETPEMRSLINKYADLYGVPRPLVHKVVERESQYRANVRNGPNYGLMQIQPETARSMGFEGQAADLLDAETNLRWAVK